MKRSMMRRKGFTLIEIAIAIAIIAVLAVTVLLGARYLIQDSKVNKTSEAADVMIKAYTLASLKTTFTAGTVVTAATIAATCDGTGTGGGTVTAADWKANFYPSGICTQVDGTTYGIGGLVFGANRFGVKVNCAAGTCDTIWAKLNGSYKVSTAAVGALPLAQCNTATPGAAATSFVYCTEM